MGLTLLAMEGIGDVQWRRVACAYMYMHGALQESRATDRHKKPTLHAYSNLEKNKKKPPPCKSRVSQRTMTKSKKANEPDQNIARDAASCFTTHEQIGLHPCARPVGKKKLNKVRCHKALPLSLIRNTDSKGSTSNHKQFQSLATDKKGIQFGMMHKKKIAAEG